MVEDEIKVEKGLIEQKEDLDAFQRLAEQVPGITVTHRPMTAEEKPDGTRPGEWDNTIVAEFSGSPQTLAKHHQTMDSQEQVKRKRTLKQTRRIPRQQI